MLKRADGRRAQVWSAVNHLEAAAVALDSKLVWNPGQNSSRAPLWNGSILASKRKCALALLAICYRYLGEESSYNKALEKAKARTIRKRFTATPQATLVGNDSNIVDDYRYRRAKDNWVTFVYQLMMRFAE